jgi:hypothetical protein
MAKMAHYAITNMKSAILGELYQKREDDLDERRTAIAKQSRELYLNPYQHLIAQLPKEMVSHDREYKVKIEYFPPKKLFEDKSDISVNEKWTFREETPVINPVHTTNRGSYNQTPENDLQEELQEVSDKLCEDILELLIERQSMTEYLTVTTNKYTGSVQLREKWKNEPAFFKHLPPEPAKIKKPKPAKKVPIPDLEIPAFLKERKTINLLEDN